MVISKEKDDGSTDSGEEFDRGRAGGDDNNKTASKCSHIVKSVDSTKLKKLIKANGIQTKCLECEKQKCLPLNDDEEGEYDTTLWLCLRCGVQLCGRRCNKHALDHYEKPHSDMHSITFNTTTFLIWCYKCDDEVSEDSHKKLLDCVSFLKKECQKPPIEGGYEEKIPAILETMQPLLSELNTNSNYKLTDTSESSMSVTYNLTLPAQRKTQENATDNNSLSGAMLPRVRGLSNLGNTCFFNAVVQNLAQTPYLLEVLSESLEAGEKFELPGGELKVNDEETVELSSVKGELGAAGSFTKALHNTLDQLQRSGGVFTPRELLSQFTSKWPQFAGGDQHDSHEALRHLLDSVKNEDLRRYQSVILKDLGYNSKTDPKSVREDDKSKIKYFGKKAEDRIMVPEPVFRGFMVSTLTCQDCNHISPRQEYFLDISLPVTGDKPQPPTRRKLSPEPNISQPIGPSKSQLKKEKRAERKAKRTAKIQNRKNQYASVSNENEENSDSKATSDKENERNNLSSGPSSMSSDTSDADVEDNLTDEKQSKKSQCDANGNKCSDIASPQNPEKKDDMPENPFKGESAEANKNEGVENIFSEMTLSSKGLSSLSTQISKISAADEENTIGEIEGVDRENAIRSQQKKCQQKQRERLTSHIDWSNTLSPRYQCPEGELSIQSCLNNFTAVELMTGTNKVGCEACTERINGKKGKTVNTTATKQFLISSPPAVLILHLKRFQVGIRGMFRKIPKHVSFPLILDIAPFCASKVKLLHHVNRHQKKILYSLYGIVEHSGGMFGGHYVAYVKVRPKLTKEDPRWNFLAKGTKTELDQLDEQKIILEKQTEKVKKRQISMTKDSDDSFSNTSTENSADEEENAVGGSDEPQCEPPPGKWYYVSDSHVREVTESEVLNAQAYCLFYERIF